MRQGLLPRVTLNPLGLMLHSHAISDEKRWAEAFAKLRREKEREYRRFVRSLPARERRWIAEYEQRRAERRELDRKAREALGKHYKPLRPYSLNAFLMLKRRAWAIRMDRKPAHGTRACYTVDGCRCRACRRAQANYMREHRAQRQSRS